MSSASCSASSSQENCSEEDFIEQSLIFQAYTNEPLADIDNRDERNGEETDDKDGMLSATLAQRFHREVEVNSL